VNQAQGLRESSSPTTILRRNKDGSRILDRLIKLRKDVRAASSSRSTTLCHKLPNFIEKCALRASSACSSAREHIPTTCRCQKRQNKITEYRKMLLAWKSAGVITYAGYISLPQRYGGVFLHDIDVIKSELPVDLLDSSTSRRCRLGRTIKTPSRRAWRWMPT